MYHYHQSGKKACKWLNNLKNPNNGMRKICNQDFEVYTSNSYSELSDENEELQLNETDETVTRSNHFRRRKNKVLVRYLNFDKVKVELYADSLGRDRPELVGLCSKGRIFMNGLVKPG